MGNSGSVERQGLDLVSLTVSWKGTALQAAEKLGTVGIAVEERPFQGRVSRMESVRALAPVVAWRVATDFFRSLFSRADQAARIWALPP